MIYRLSHDASTAYCRLNALVCETTSAKASFSTSLRWGFQVSINRITRVPVPRFQA